MSIVILAWNAWGSTRSCLDSLRPTLGVRDEVIVVNNGSTDETAASLDRYPWVRVVSNVENRGFAGGCNDGASIASNGILIFLNNDTVLAGRWIEPLVKALESSTVGAAGPRSNFVSGPQIIENAQYANTSAMRRFSRDWCRSHKGKVSDASRLVGFCLAIRADLFSSLGGFDESYGIGGYEDDDLCRRVEASGHRLVICHDSFVHHDGHKTFDANGLDWYAEQERNRGRFQSAHSLPSEAKLRVSACLITRDEEDNLPKCLESIRDLVDEIVVYDTGSTDKTTELALLAGAKLIEGYWDDDFSRARNASLEHCTGDWILWIDADETLEAITTEQLRSSLSRIHPDIDALSVAIHNEMGAGVGSAFIHRAARLFRRSRCEWSGRLHEQITKRHTHAPIKQGDFEDGFIHHTGYLDVVLTTRNKRERNLHLARVEVDTSDGWERAHSLTSLARSCILAGRFEEGYRRALEALDNQPNAMVKRMALRAAIEGLLGMQQFTEALARCDELRRESEKPLLANMLEARARFALQDWRTALDLLDSTDFDDPDADGFGYSAGSLAVQRAEALDHLGRYQEAADALITVLFEEGILDAHVGTVVELLDKSGQSLEILASAIPEAKAPLFLAQALQLEAPIADRLLEVCYANPALKTPTLAAAATLAKRLTVDRALVWSARIRAAGYASACPLLAIATSDQPSVIRARAAATAFAAFHDVTARSALEDILRFASPTERDLALAEASELSPQLVPELTRTVASRREPARADEPLASIVIPCFNKAELTLQCLQSLVSSTHSHLYEVILVDNGSTDQTEALQDIRSDRFTVIRNTANLGFARACNQGAAAAVAETIIFLNNDTIARPEWLEWLLRGFDRDHNIAVVGSRLLFPDGTIQHAGVEVGWDEQGQLHGFHLNYRQPGASPDVLIPRHVTAVTGAALAVRSVVFKQVGGFHEGYWNGNEDVDLCLKVREAGFEVFYEPRSVLVHLESQSGHERFTGYGDNVALFNERWSKKSTTFVKRASMPVLAR